jgi:hypothetical protein
MVPILGIMAMAWGGQYPPTGGLHQVWRGLALTFLMFILGTLAYLGMLYFRADGVPQPFAMISLVLTILVVFWLVIEWDTWPWHKMSMPVRGFFTLLTGYLIGWGLTCLFNFDFLSYPTGVKPSPIGAVPFYAEGGPYAAFGALAPSGPVAWEAAIAYSFWFIVFMFTFVILLGMWPFSRHPALMKQPLKGVVMTATSGICAYIAYIIGVGVMNTEPIRFFLIGICYIFGVLMILLMFQLWPGRAVKGPGGGFMRVYQYHLQHNTWHCRLLLDVELC